MEHIPTAMTKCWKQCAFDATHARQEVSGQSPLFYMTNRKEDMLLMRQTVTFKDITFSTIL